ncbi:hypothetical protein CYMTET_6663 [Cymbomonas tetramitiformis]|uniref:Uncharacterized protein n=1 Tax=Cymbomonas tetramitiformis TaxID=36881 RepID=A0AAE0GWM1_9CHLO|nr:hypothetical protein CYMTET_6663 [Cymbomonas tetramitiformis]
MRAWREMSHAEHLAAAALAEEKPQWKDAWVPEGWRRYKRRWNNWHGEVSVALLVENESVNMTLETECGTMPGSGGDVGPGVPDAWCSLYRVHQYRQQEREAAEDAVPP